MSRLGRALQSWLGLACVVCACRHSPQSGPAQDGSGVASDAGLHTDQPGIRPDTGAPIGPLAHNAASPSRTHASELRMQGIGGLPGLGGMGGLGGVGGSGATGAIAGAGESAEAELAPYLYAQESTATPSSLRSSKYSGLIE